MGPMSFPIGAAWMPISIENLPGAYCLSLEPTAAHPHSGKCSGYEDVKNGFLYHHRLILLWAFGASWCLNALQPLNQDAKLPIQQHWLHLTTKHPPQVYWKPVVPLYPLVRVFHGLQFQPLCAALLEQSVSTTQFSLWHRYIRAKNIRKIYIILQKGGEIKYCKKYIWFNVFQALTEVCLSCVYGTFMCGAETACG